MSFKRKVWLYDRGDYNSLRQETSNTNWDDIINEDLDIYATNLSNHIISLAEKQIPNKYVTVRNAEPMWLNSQLRRMIRKRKRLFKKAKRTKLSQDMNLYKQYRNEVTKLIRKSKKSHIDDIANKLKTQKPSSNDWWKYLKPFFKSSSSSGIPTLLKDDIFYSNDIEKANILNGHFIGQTNLQDNNKELPKLNISDNTPSINGIKLNPNEVKDILQNLQLGKSSGPDGINNRILKELSSELAYPLCSLFNSSLSSGSFPSFWKEANVTPIFKKDDTSNVSNYRPISLLNTIGKVMEKLVHKHVFNFFLSNNTIFSFQSGFVTGDSTVNQLVNMYNTFCKALDEGKEVRAVFLDISKAFDRVCHRGLLHKLNYVGIRGRLLDWFSDYLQTEDKELFFLVLVLIGLI